MENEAPRFKAGYVALIGEPNVGKSTLMNVLLRQKISIVTRKPQTTRHKILGILSGEHYQIIFLDTPGIIAPHYRLQELMMRHASAAVGEADIVLLIVDASHRMESALREEGAGLREIRAAGKKTILVINKIDRVEKVEILRMIDVSRKTFPFEDVVPLSALRDEGIDELLAVIVKSLPEHPPYYSHDVVSEAPEKFFVSEIIREKIFERFSQEIPYSTAVDIVAFNERKNKKHFIGAEIIVERPSQKGILIGKGGAALKSLGEQARREIEVFLEHPVFLELRVKVREHWRKDKTWLKRLGYANP